MRRRLPSSTHSPLAFGFTVLEIITVLALIGILVAVGLNQFGIGLPSRVRDLRLESDMTRLNQMVALYAADGGDLSTANTAQEVLDRMKRVRPRAEEKTNVGVSSGRLIDVRLVASMGAGALPSGQTFRVAWDPAAKRFVKSTGSGVQEFYFDDALADTMFPLDTRAKSEFQMNGNTGWVWGNAAPNSPVTYVSADTMNAGGASNTFDPSAPPSSTATGSGIGGGSPGTGPGPGPGPGPAVSSPPQAPPRTTFLPPPGAFPAGDFPIQVTISDGGAPSGQSTLQVSIGGAPPVPYGGAFNVPPGTTVTATNVVNPSAAALYSTGPSASASYYRLVSDFTGTAPGAFINPVGGVSSTTSGPTATFSHGDPNLLINGVPTLSGVASTITYTQQSFTTVQPNVSFTIGNMTMVNGTTFNNSEASGVTLQLNLNLTSPAITQAVNLQLAMTNTDNSADPIASADVVTITNPAAASFVIDGVTYTLQLEWVTLDPGAGVVQGNQFLVFENQSARAQLRGKLVPSTP
jgi:type II secretory pathway pseudopilin PulG